MRLLFCSLLIIAGLTAGCTSDKDSSAASADSTSTATVEVATFEGLGLVMSVLPNRKYVVVDHEDMPGFMSAMKMPFALRDTSVATGVAAGDSVRFTVEVQGPNIHMIQISVLP
ncbi:MAG: copper-binding protein [Rhodothermales bacterium]|nr:copper-binding protein [Rhodothermales bacterium]